MCLTCCKTLSDAERVTYPAAIFGAAFPFVVEPTVFAIAERLSVDYRGGLWEFYALSNGGFYMALQSDESFRVHCENGLEGRLSAEAFGITVCLYAYSQLSFGEGAGAERCAEQFHLLREHMLERREAGAILAAID